MIGGAGRGRPARRAALLALLAIAALPVAAGATPTGRAAASAATTAPPVAKKHQLLADKAAAEAADSDARRAARTRALARRVGKPPEEVVNVVNTWTDEVLPLPAEGKVSISREVVDRFLRCHFTNEPTRMDARLFDVLTRAARHFKSRRVDIVSGFRAPKYNLMLRKKGREVARDSQHTKGHAVDFRLRGVPIAKLRAWALKLRLGGVGFYKDSGFIHVDVGPVRRWGGD